MEEIAPRVAVIPTLIANAYLVGDHNSWVLVDACTPGNDKRIRRAAESRFGRGSRPRAILLTHGHFDHAGSAGPLADAWDVPIYAHAVEIPYLTRQAKYPPFDLSSPGFFTRLARFFPTSTVDLGTRVTGAGRKEPIPGLPDWEMIGHARPYTEAIFHSSAARIQCSLAGDAVTTMNLDSFFGTITSANRCVALRRPPRRIGRMPERRWNCWRVCSRFR